MIPETLKNRLKKDRKITTITLRLPADLVEVLETISAHKGMSSYQALLKAYVGEGLRRDEVLVSWNSEIVEREPTKGKQDK